MRTLFFSGAVGGLSDGRLLEQFVASRDEFAFERLLERHGPMVWGVCRRVLGDHHDAEDAFQAAFLVLARKAASVSPRESVGGWLHGVATRTARKARTTAARRKAREHRLASWTRPNSATEAAPTHDLAALLDIELARLPESQRSAIVLCDLEGRTRAEAARHLGWPAGTLASRLARGRARLAARLARRGLSPINPDDPARALPAGLILPAGLAAKAAHTASLALSGSLPAGAISSRVAALADWGTRIAGLQTTLITVAVMTLALGGTFSYMALASPPTELRQLQPATKPPTAARAEDIGKLRADTDDALNRLIAIIPAITDLDDRIFILCELARIQGRAGLEKPLESTIEQVIRDANESESDQRRRDVAGYLAGLGRGARAFQLVNEIRKNDDRMNSLVSVVANMAVAGDLDGALRTAAAIKEARSRAEVLATIASLRADRDDLSGAMRAVEALYDDQPDLKQDEDSYFRNERPRALLAVAAAQSRLKDPNAAITLERAVKAARSIPRVIDGDGLEWGDRTWAMISLAAGVARAGDDARAQEIIQGMRIPSKLLDQAWVDLASAQAFRGDPKLAIATLERVKNDDLKKWSVEPVVKALIKTGDFEHARRVADAASDPSVRIRARVDLAKGLAMEGHQREADELFTRIRGEASVVAQTSEYWNPTRDAFGYLAKAQAEIGEQATALAWIERETIPTTKAWALLGLAGGLADRLPPQTRRVPEPLPLNLLNDDPPAPTVKAPPLSEPRVSYSGKLILFGTTRADRPGTSAIEAMDLDGSDPETLLTLGKDEFIEIGRVSPDGSRLAFSILDPAVEGVHRSASSWVFSAEGGRKKLTENATLMAWSPDGTQLVAYRRRDENSVENFLIDASNGKIRPLPLSETDIVSDWSPDGQSFAVIESNPKLTYEQKGTYPLRRLSLVKPDGTDRKPFSIGPPDHDSINARFSTDGKRLAFTEVRHIDGRRQHLAVVQTLDGSPPQDLAAIHDLRQGSHEFDLHSMPCWSPDGKTVTWMLGRQKVSSSPRHMELFTATPATGKISRLDLDKLGITGIGSLDWR
ncbi:sigma-70 family RNA polymerase sigma factor [Isosphaeraceae bacterium EP7]